MPFTNLDRTIADLMQRESIPGLAFALVQGNEIIEAHGYGVTAGEDGGLPVTPTRSFALAPLPSCWLVPP